ncbi:MAG: hypothetical protein KAT15_01100, partial [Bacteroidales bacterium]|nr:hypothetical protein [Bacteroidales bacterium]
MMINRVIPVVIITMVISGCSKYGYVQLNYPTAPVAYLPDDVHAIAVVNRSLTGEEDKNNRLVESITTGEVAGSDRLASDECIKGVFDAIKDLEHAELVIPSEARMVGTGTRELPELLDWGQVKEICESEEADALLVLETFDSNSDILLSAAAEQVAAILSTGSPKPVAPGQVRVHVVCYWRLYDPMAQRIIDQYQHNSYLTFNLKESLPPPHALPETAYASGVAYIRRFLPGTYVVRRDLYKRTSGSVKQRFKAGYRSAEVANWQGAIEIWEALSNYGKRKTAGRACLNVAVANEVLGNTDTALEWAQKSYEYYDDKLGRSYTKILLNRRNIEGF